MKKTVKERFEEKYEPVTESGCWVWTGGVGSSGYAQFWLDGKTVQASRVAFSLHKGNIPEGLQVCHTCDNRLCVNPDHLFLGTASDNAKDKADKGRSVKGESNHHAKLKEHEVLEIKKLLKEGYKHREIAEVFNVSRMAISDINNSRSWKHL